MNAPELLTVEVTADDIMHGLRQDNCECAVALALKRLPGVVNVFVEPDDAEIEYRIDGATYDTHYQLPQEADAFICAFDRGEHVEPFTFTAELEEEWPS